MTGNAPKAAQLDRDDVERTVIGIVSRMCGYPKDKIGPDTDLVVDVGVAGDDANELFLEIMKVYPVDFSQTGWGTRFGREGFWPWEIPILLFRILIYPIQRWVLGKSPQEIFGPGVLVSDVVDVIMAKNT